MASTVTRGPRWECGLLKVNINVHPVGKMVDTKHPSWTFSFWWWFVCLTCVTVTSLVLYEKGGCEDDIPRQGPLCVIFSRALDRHCALCQQPSRRAWLTVAGAVTTVVGGTELQTEYWDDLPRYKIQKSKPELSEMSLRYAMHCTGFYTKVTLEPEGLWKG